MSMTTRVALVTDSTCNLPHDLAAERHIYAAPLYILWGEASYKDGIDITEQELFRKMREASDELPKTSQVSVQDFAEMFEAARQAESADEIVCAVISCDLSGTYASAVQAKEMVDFPVHVLDTRQTSWALGFPVLSGADARDSGASAEEIVQVIAETARRSCLVFTVESLDYLHRGGRIGNASWLLGTALNIKPLLELKDGLIEAADKVRTRKRAAEHLIKVAEDRAGGHPIQRLAIMHGGAEEEAKELRNNAVEKLTPSESYLSYVAAVLGVHVGPSALGVIVQWAS
jgi:DegV family protein with EDD domain